MASPVASAGSSALTATEIAEQWRQIKEMMAKRINPPLLDPSYDPYYFPKRLPMAAGQPPKSAVEFDSEQLAKMARMRLRTPSGSYFDHWHFHKVNDEKVIVMVVNNGQFTVLEDEWPLFPSDKLITQLRLLER